MIHSLQGLGRTGKQAGAAMTQAFKGTTSSGDARPLPMARSLPIGAEVRPDGTHFRLWAPKAKSVEIVFEDGAPLQRVQLTAEAEGYFSRLVPGVGAGALYRFRLDSDDTLLSDPASRFQPEGPQGPSMVIDPALYAWKTRGWHGVKAEDAVFYEMHIGTFTPEGTFAAAMRELPYLAELGITVIEIMPVADFAGQFGWGYDGVNLFAPTRLYGAPDDMRAFVDEAHRLGIAVILDVVYNHLGPDGNVLPSFSEGYLSAQGTDWGVAINFDGRDSGPIREFYLANARYWIEEFRLDGFRLDSTQDIHDKSAPHILAEIARTVREAAGDRATLIVAENEPQETQLVRPVEKGGFGLDMLWNDDFHHSAMVALSGRHEAYYSDYRGTPQEFISSAKYGYLFQGQVYVWQGKRRGTPTFGLTGRHFVNYTQNHDQIGNSGHGLRCHELSGAALNRAITALLILSPGTPLLFQGQEFAATTPFFYFADHQGELGKGVRTGRAKFLSQFASHASDEMQASLCDPCDRNTFDRSKLKLEERASRGRWLALHRDLLKLRREIIAPISPKLDGAVLGRSSFLLRYFIADDGDVLLLMNLGGDSSESHLPEPLLAAPAGKEWTMIWSSEDPRYGGTGTPPVFTPAGLMLPGRSALLLRATGREAPVQ
jgi:maltooligosyltrehalose trehalohydrolase